MRRRRVVPHPPSPFTLPPLPPVVVIPVNQRSSLYPNGSLFVNKPLSFVFVCSFRPVCVTVSCGLFGVCLLFLRCRSTTVPAAHTPRVTTAHHHHTTVHTHDTQECSRATSTLHSHSHSSPLRARTSHRDHRHAQREDEAAATIPHRTAVDHDDVAVAVVALCTAVGSSCSIHCSCACRCGVAAEWLTGAVCSARAGEWLASGADPSGRAGWVEERLRHCAALCHPNSRSSSRAGDDMICMCGAWLLTVTLGGAETGCGRPQQRRTADARHGGSARTARGCVVAARIR